MHARIFIDSEQNWSTSMSSRIGRSEFEEDQPEEIMTRKAEGITPIGSNMRLRGYGPPQAEPVVKAEEGEPETNEMLIISDNEELSVSVEQVYAAPWRYWGAPGSIL